MTDRCQWFEWEDDLPCEVEEFLEAARAEAASWPDANPLASQVYELEAGFVLGLDVSDLDRKVGLRTLRVDY